MNGLRVVSAGGSSSIGKGVERKGGPRGRESFGSGVCFVRLQFIIFCPTILVYSGAQYVLPTTFVCEYVCRAGRSPLRGVSLESSFAVVRRVCEDIIHFNKVLHESRHIVCWVGET